MLLVACADYKIADTIDYITQLGFSVCPMPVLAITPTSYTFPEDIGGILLTSSAPTDLIEHHGLPTYVVGKRTAEKAREKGFNVVYAGSGNAEDMAADLAKMTLPAKCWHPTNPEGKEAWYNHLPNTTIQRDIVYTLTFTDHIPQEVLTCLQNSEITDVLLMSAMGAQNFANLITQENIDTGHIHLIAFSDAVAETVKNLPFAQKTTLPTPSLEALTQIQMT
jgi:uroporphyrinogen-III synthase